MFSNASFSSLASIYNNLHLDCLPEDLACKRYSRVWKRKVEHKTVLFIREEVYKKRITDAYFLYVFLELMNVRNLKTYQFDYDFFFCRDMVFRCVWVSILMKPSMINFHSYENSSELIGPNISVIKLGVAVLLFVMEEWNLTERLVD